MFDVFPNSRRSRHDAVSHYNIVGGCGGWMDVALEMEKQAERAALVNAACSAHCSISSATLTLSTLYT